MLLKTHYNKMNKHIPSSEKIRSSFPTGLNMTVLVVIIASVEMLDKVVLGNFQKIQKSSCSISTPESRVGNYNLKDLPVATNLF